MMQDIFGSRRNKKCIPGQGNDNSRTRDHIPHTFAYIIDFIHAGGTGTAIQVDIKDICSLIKVRGSCSRHFQPSSPSKESDTIEKRELCVSSQFINNDHTGAAIPLTLNYSQKRPQFARLQRHIHNIICSLIKVRGKNMMQDIFGSRWNKKMYSR